MRKAAKACETLDLVLSVIIYLVEDKNCMAVYCRRKVDDEFDGIGVGLFLLLFWCFFFPPSCAVEPHPVIMEGTEIPGQSFREWQDIGCS